MNRLGYDSHIIKEIKKQKAKHSSGNIYLVDELGILEKYLASGNKSSFRLKHLLICKELYARYKTCSSFAKLCIYAENVHEISLKTYQSIIKKTYSEGLFAVFYGTGESELNLAGGNMKTIVVLDGLEYPGNIGTILRTADAADIGCVIITNCRINMNNDKIIAGSRGTVFNVPFCITEPELAIELLQREKYKILLCEPESGMQYSKADYSGKTAMVFGSESRGISDLWFAAPHNEVYIPMSGAMDSLNVGVAASIIMYESYLRNKQAVEINQPII